jgi:UDPglucose 6-dehydrogenase
VPGAVEAVEGADALLLMTEWNEFRWLDFGQVRDAMARPIVVDARNFLDPHLLRQLGFTYEGVGR